MEAFLRALAVLALSCLIVAEVSATRSYMSGLTITQLRSYGDGNFSACVIGLDASINTSGSNTLSCVKEYLVSLDCSGQHYSKTDAAAMYSTAQLAYVTGKTISIFVDDTKTVNEEVCTSSLVFIDP